MMNMYDLSVYMKCVHINVLLCIFKYITDFCVYTFVVFAIIIILLYTCTSGEITKICI